MVTRYDRGELKPAHRSPEGYLFFEGYATRAGVFNYRRQDGTIIRELRPPEEVGNPESVASLARKPVTDLHPKEFVDASNADEYAVGVVDGEVIWETDFADGFVKVRGTIQREDAVDSIDQGRRELSCGYTAEIEDTSGVWVDADGREHAYDAIQRNIRYNHLALVDRGRAGKDARLRADSDAVMVDDIPNRADDGIGAQQLEIPMGDLRIDGREYGADEVKAVQRAIDEVVDARDRADAEAKELTEKLDGMSATMATLDEKMKMLEGKAAELDVLKAAADMARENGMHGMKEDNAERLQWFNDRMALINELNKREIKADGLDEMENEDIKKAIVLSRFDEADVPSDAHVDAAFSLMQKEDAKPAKKSTLAGELLASQQGRVDEGQKALQDAQAVYDKWINQAAQEA